jgi:hypothetical protein
MFFSTSSPRLVGAAPSGSSDSSALFVSLLVAFCISAFGIIGRPSGSGLAYAAAIESGQPALTREAANQCSEKLKNLEYFAAHRKTGQKQTTRFTENEVNSYLALDLRSKYHPSLKSLNVRFEEDKLQGVASIDFDRLGKTSTKLLPKLLSFMLSGVHTLTARGRLVSGNGKASFRLEQARFDTSTLPKFLVEEIITTVGRKQKPPFDPLQPSNLFDGIDKVDVHVGYILVHQ